MPSVGCAHRGTTTTTATLPVALQLTPLSWQSNNEARPGREHVGNGRRSLSVCVGTAVLQPRNVANRLLALGAGFHCPPPLPLQLRTNAASLRPASATGTLGICWCTRTIPRTKKVPRPLYYIQYTDCCSYDMCVCV